MTAYSNPAHVPNPDDPSRPGMIRALASVGLAFGALGIVCAPFAGMKLVGSSNDTNLLLHSPDGPWLLATSVLSAALSLLLIIASSGCLRLRAWGRTTMTVYAVAALVFGVGAGYFYLHLLGLVGRVPHAANGLHVGVVGWL